MATKEEYLWEITSGNKYTTRDFRLWVCEALAERDAAREELARAVKDADPNIKTPGPLPSSLETSTFIAESAPVVGGVTEAMLDAIDSFVAGWTDCDKYEHAVGTARLASRAQKRVDVEAIREVARALQSRGLFGSAKLLLAIGDEPAEAPVAEPAAQEGPFTARGQNLWEGERVIAWCNAYANLGRLVSLLNAGLEVEKLRQGLAHAEQVARNWEATAAQFSKNSDFYQGLLRRIGNVFGTAARTADDGTEQDDVLALKVPELVEELHRRMVAIDEKCVAIVGIEHAGKLAEGSTDAVIARMKDAEAKLAAHEAEREAIRRSLGEVMPAGKSIRIECAVENAIGYLRRFPKLEADSEKLAAIGENPIPRALVERYLNVPGSICVRVLENILAGREPGVAS